MMGYGLLSLLTGEGSQIGVPTAAAGNSLLRLLGSTGGLDTGATVDPMNGAKRIYNPSGCWANPQQHCSSATYKLSSNILLSHKKLITYIFSKLKKHILFFSRKEISR